MCVCVCGWGVGRVLANAQSTHPPDPLLPLPQHLLWLGLGLLTPTHCFPFHATHLHHRHQGHVDPREEDDVAQQRGERPPHAPGRQGGGAGATVVLDLGGLCGGCGGRGRVVFDLVGGGGGLVCSFTRTNISTNQSNQPTKTCIRSSFKSSHNTHAPAISLASSSMEAPRYSRVKVKSASHSPLCSLSTVLVGLFVLLSLPYIE